MNHLAQRNAQLLAGAAAQGAGGMWQAMPWGRAPGAFAPGGAGGYGGDVVEAAKAVLYAANQAPAANGGGGCAGGMNPEVMAQIAWLMKGGTQADGLVCAPHPNPPVPRNADGCLAGKIQCKQPLSATSLAVGVGATVLITVTPRSMAVARQFFYGGTVGAFTIDSVIINGRDYLNGAITADRYGGIVDDLSVDWGDGYSSTTPLLMTVTNISAAIDDFRGVVDSSIDY